VTRASATPAGTLVLDSEGLAKAVLRVREVTQWLALARADDLRVITSAATVVEAAHPRLNRPALEWTLSRIVVEPVTEPIARRASAILAGAGLHGHRHAIDAMLSATALAAPGPVTVLTSDPEDIATLCGRNVTVIKVLRDGPGAKRAGRAGSAATELPSSSSSQLGGCLTGCPDFFPAGWRGWRGERGDTGPGSGCR
jgi:predicted nucleic acid-binding protein